MCVFPYQYTSVERIDVFARVPSDYEKPSPINEAKNESALAGFLTLAVGFQPMATAKGLNSFNLHDTPLKYMNQKVQG